MREEKKQALVKRETVYLSALGAFLSFDKLSRRFFILERSFLTYININKLMM
jgi:hypothetical protein